MELLGVGLPELLMILLVALLVVGPQKLPEVAVQIARFIREFRAYTASMTRELTDALEDLEREVTETKTEFKDVKDEWKDIGQGLHSSVSEITGPLRSAQQEARTGQSAGTSTPLPPPGEIATDGHTGADGRESAGS